jgi:hypothetical protein
LCCCEGRGGECKQASESHQSSANGGRGEGADFIPLDGGLAENSMVEDALKRLKRIPVIVAA